MNVSVAKLVKCTARQYIYLSREGGKGPVSQRVLNGTAYQEEVVTSKYEEMRGEYRTPNNVLYYCFDEVIRGNSLLKFIEHKHFDNEEVPQWFINSSVAQLALYESLFRKSNRQLVTATFHVNNGNDKLTLNTDNYKLSSRLHILDNKLKLRIKDCDKIINFYLDKLKHTANYELASEWDRKYKHKEYEQVKPYIEVIKL